eukprot:TRINITY_DN45955_c0_g1_i1.p1 TRINITY_DN45955_c0_g1~~TRINITY_DN45955_c0_g1_i1.p1  ORF type:complete len:326 (+),score=30.79 TRINITY_DN45955_c0_g1_i1:54-1031(+)
MLPNIPSFLARFIFHNTRLYGWVPAAATMLRYQYGRLFLVAYCLGRKSNAWRSFVHHLFRYGVKDSPCRFQNDLTQPLKPPSEKRYMMTGHPHGLLLDGWHILIAKEPESFKPDNNHLGGVPNLKPFLCFSPAIQYVPAHQECFRERCGGASAKDVEQVLLTTDCIPAICPGGFAEAVWCWSNDKYEYSWLKNNARFIAVAIKNNTDIIVSYTYGLSSAYKTNTFFRQELAEISQKWQFPTVIAMGRLFGMPMHEDMVTVLYDPFPVNKYTLDDVDQALEDYMQYLKVCFDKDKGKYGMGEKELLFIGPRNTGKTKTQPLIRSNL